jgi:glucokinase
MLDLVSAMAKETFILGIDIGATHTSFAVVSKKGKIFQPRILERKDAQGPLVESILELSEKIIEAAREEGREVSGIGIGSPGIVDSKNGAVIAAGNLPELFGARLRDIFEEKLRLPVSVENDVNALALGEMLFGVAKGQKNFVVFALGTDLGGGIVIDGKLHGGANFIAAEFGHLTLDLTGRQCVCGGFGCAREYVSGEGLAEQGRRLLGDGSAAVKLAGKRESLKAAHIFRAWREGDAEASALIEEFGKRFGALVSNVMKVLDPEVVVIAGEVCRQEPEVMNLVVKWTRHFYFPIPRLPEFRLSVFSKQESVLGPVAAFLIERKRGLKK